MYLVAAVNKPLVKDLLESPPMNMYNREPLSFVEWRGGKKSKERAGGKGEGMEHNRKNKCRRKRRIELLGLTKCSP